MINRTRASAFLPQISGSDVVQGILNIGLEFLRRRFSLTCARPAGQQTLQGFATTLLSLLAICSMHTADGMTQDVSNIEDHYWVCSYDFQTATSQRLFAVPQLNSIGSVSYSPDQKLIAFDGLAPGGQLISDSHIFVCKPDGSELQDLGPGTMPSWSPRGKRIAFSRYSPEYGVWTMSSDGSNAQLLDNQGWSAEWSQNGNMIAYTRQLKGADDFIIFNLVEDEITAVFGDGSSGYSSFDGKFAWSPDSTKICFRGTADRSAIIGFIDIATPKQATVVSTQERIAPDFTWFDNSTVITSIRSTSPGGRQLYQLNTSAPTSAPVVLEGQFTDRANSDPDVSRDGRTMLYVSRKLRK